MSEGPERGIRRPARRRRATDELVERRGHDAHNRNQPHASGILLGNEGGRWRIETATGAVYLADLDERTLTWHGKALRDRGASVRPLHLIETCRVGYPATFVLAPAARVQVRRVTTIVTSITLVRCAATNE